MTSTDLVIRAGRVVDCTGAPPRTGVEVVVRHGTIAEIRTAHEAPEPGTDHARVIEEPDCTLLPGLIDMHMHTIHWGQPVGVPWQRDSLLAAGLRGIRHAATLLDMGVTTVRDVAARENLSIQLRDLINEGVISGPRMYATGTPLECYGRADYAFAGLHINGPDEARAAARTQLRAGADWIKILATAGCGGGTGTMIGEPGWQELTEEEIRAAALEAHHGGRKITAHAIGTEGVKAAVRAGVDCIEHGSFLDDEAVELMGESDVGLVPTLRVNQTLGYQGAERGYERNIVEGAKRTLAAAFESVAKAKAAGLRVMAGSDVQVDETVIEEIELLVEAGLTPMEALVAATRLPARQLGREHDLGTVEPGKIADLILVDGDPTVDPAHLNKVAYTIQAGTIVKSRSESPVPGRAR
jgi:imidazolonepropionase-like amidohydrolase